LTSTSPAIGLALSGGGMRAMAFHCGVLRWLAETQRMEKVAHISSVSGGTLITGLVFRLSSWQWPSSANYLDDVQQRVRSVLTNRNLSGNALLRLLAPTNWRHVLSRANVLSQAIERIWQINICLSELPRLPVWSINATTAETGRRFRFKLDRCGDYELGYADARRFKLADAMAVSAALPGAIGPLALRTKDYIWKQRPWGAPVEDEITTTIPYERLHLYDGGVYDNLALEPLMDPGTQRLKSEIEYLVCSDAGAPLKRVAPLALWNPFRAIRILEIALDQARALRVRSFANFLQRNANSGVYAQIGANPVERLAQLREADPIKAAELLRCLWLGEADIRRAALHETTLFPMTDDQFTNLERHGYESIKWNELFFVSTASIP
jgi:NTE family protein